MTPEPKIIGHPLPFMGSFKRACWLIPEIVAASGMALIGVVLGCVGVMKYAKNDGDNREYKTIYTVVRSDDPRACRLKNPVYTSYKC